MTQKGFAPIIILVGVFVILTVASGAFYLGRLTTLKTSPNPVITSLFPQPSSVQITQTPQSTFAPSPTPGEFAKSNFNFIFKMGDLSGESNGVNILDTFKKTYTQDMVIDPPITASFSLTQSEMKQIYQKMIEINLFDYSDNFIDSEATCLFDPSNANDNFYLYIEHNLIKKEIKWKDHPKECTSKIDGKVQALQDLKQLMINIITSTEEYKKLPKPRSSYL